jgi:hypothetical protein
MNTLKVLTSRQVSSRTGLAKRRRIEAANKPLAESIAKVCQHEPGWQCEGRGDEDAHGKHRNDEQPPSSRRTQEQGTKQNRIWKPERTSQCVAKGHPIAEGNEEGRLEQAQCGDDTQMRRFAGGAQKCWRNLPVGLWILCDCVHRQSRSSSAAGVLHAIQSSSAGQPNGDGRC